MIQSLWRSIAAAMVIIIGAVRILIVVALGSVLRSIVWLVAVVLSRGLRTKNRPEGLLLSRSEVPVRGVVATRVLMIVLTGGVGVLVVIPLILRR